jgi:hypothetical protein
VTAVLYLQSRGILYVQFRPSETLLCSGCLQVARLARKLPQGELAVMSLQLGGSGGVGGGVEATEDGEEDLT